MAETGEGTRLDSQAERPRGRSRVVTIHSGGCWAAQYLSRMHSVDRDPGSWTNHLCGLKWSCVREQNDTMKEKELGAFLGSQTVKNLPAELETACSVGDTGSIQKIPWHRKWQSTPVSVPGKSCGQRSLAGYSLWGSQELDMT